MANYYSIKIPKPCHEGWDTMTPKDQGRFCSACNKTVIDLELIGIQRIYINFKIEKNGDIKTLQVRAPHKTLEKEAIRLIKTLPQFIPAKNEGKSVSTIYTLPIIFKAEEE